MFVHTCFWICGLNSDFHATISVLDAGAARNSKCGRHGYAPSQSPQLPIRTISRTKAKTAKIRWAVPSPWTLVATRIIQRYTCSADTISPRNWEWFGSFSAAGGIRRYFFFSLLLVVLVRNMRAPDSTAADDFGQIAKYICLHPFRTWPPRRHTQRTT